MGYEAIDGLAAEAHELLGLPHPEPLVAKVYTERTGDARLKRLALDLRSESAGILNDCERRGPFIHLGDGRVILPEKKIRDLQDQLSAGPDVAKYESAVAAQQVYHADAKRLAAMAGAIVEPWLEREHYEYPEGIHVELEGGIETGIQLHPRASGVDDDEIQSLIEENEGPPVVSERRRARANQGYPAP